MVRFIILSLSVLLAAQAAPAFGQATSINVTGQLSGGNFVSAVCSVGNNGQITGTGVLYGTNPSNGYTYKHPFSISKGSTTSGKLVLSGNIVGAGYPVTLTATVPNGPLMFTYVVNGKSYTLAGVGTVTVK